MKKKSAVLPWLVLGLALFFAGVGCRATLKPAEAPAGIVYQVSKEAQLSKVTLVEKKGYWWVDVGVKNLSDQKQAFRVSVEVDDWGAVSAVTGGKNRVPLNPKQEETVSLMTLARKPPQRLVIEISIYE